MVFGAGSGVSNVLEIFRVLATSGIKFNRTIQFMTYSAEEGIFKYIYIHNATLY